MELNWKKASKAFVLFLFQLLLCADGRGLLIVYIHDLI